MLYGASNLYIIGFLRKRDNYIVGSFEVITIFMGNFRNYKNMNNKFKEVCISKGKNATLYKSIGIIHLLSPILIPVVIVTWVISTGIN